MALNIVVTNFLPHGEHLEWRAMSPLSLHAGDKRRWIIWEFWSAVSSNYVLDAQQLVGLGNG